MSLHDRLHEKVTVLPEVYLIVSCLFILGGVINTGITGFTFAIPFVGLFIYSLRKVSVRKRILWAVSLFIICIPFLVNRDTNKILFPYIGSEMEYQPGASCILFDLHNCKIKDEKGNPILDRVVKAKIVSIKVGHPDLGLTYQPVIEDSEGGIYTTVDSFIVDSLRDGTIRSADLADLKGRGGFQSKWTRVLGDLMFWPFPPLMFMNWYID